MKPDIPATQEYVVRVLQLMLDWMEGPQSYNDWMGKRGVAIQIIQASLTILTQPTTPPAPVSVGEPVASFCTLHNAPGYIDSALCVEGKADDACTGYHLYATPHATGIVCVLCKHGGRHAVETVPCESCSCNGYVPPATVAEVAEWRGMVEEALAKCLCESGGCDECVVLCALIDKMATGAALSGGEVSDER